MKAKTVINHVPRKNVAILKCVTEYSESTILIAPNEEQLLKSQAEFKYAEVVALGEIIEDINIGDKVTIPNNIFKSIDVKGNENTFSKIKTKIGLSLEIAKGSNRVEIHNYILVHDYDILTIVQ